MSASLASAHLPRLGSGPLPVGLYLGVLILGYLVGCFVTWVLGVFVTPVESKEDIYLGVGKHHQEYGSTLEVSPFCRAPVLRRSLDHLWSNRHDGTDGTAAFRLQEPNSLSRNGYGKKTYLKKNSTLNLNSNHKCSYKIHLLKKETSSLFWFCSLRCSLLLSAAQVFLRFLTPEGEL